MSHDEQHLHDSSSEDISQEEAPVDYSSPEVSNNQEQIHYPSPVVSDEEQIHYPSFSEASHHQQQHQQPEPEQYHHSSPNMSHHDHSSDQHNSGEDRSKQRRATIVDRVNQLPIVNMAVNVSHSHYDKLKQSNVTVGEVMSRAEQWAYCIWGSVQPFVSKFQEPLGKADQLACQTLDYVEEKVPSIKKSPAQLTDEAISMKVKYAQVVEQSTIAKFVKMIAESFLKTMHSISSPTASQTTTTTTH